MSAVRYVGLDLGQLQDYTALTVIEQTFGACEDYHLGHIWRPNIGTSYHAIVDYTIRLLQRASMREQTAALVVDATGVGRPVVEMLRAARLPVRLVAVTITGGDTATQPSEDEYRVPKRDLAGELAVLLQASDPNAQDMPPTARLRFASGLRLAPILRAELNNFKAKITASGHDAYEAGPATDWREGAHDDIVLALALPLWFARTGQYFNAAPAAGPPLILPGHRGGGSAAKTPLQLAREQRERQRYGN